MARPASLMKQTRPRHSQAYKDEALALAERIGVREQSLPTRTSDSSGCWPSKPQ